MPKQRTEMSVLNSITRQLDGLTAEERERIWAYLLKRYGAQGK